MTYKERLARYDRIIAMREQDKTLEEIGASFDPPIGKERVRQIVRKGRPRADGRPPGPKRAERLQSRLAYWQAALERSTSESERNEAKRRITVIALDIDALNDSLSSQPT